MADLRGQTAIISGGLGDIGRAIAHALALAGADIALGDLLPSAEAEGLLIALRARGVRARYDCVDTADAAHVAQWVEVVGAELDTPTLIIPNAAVVTLQSLAELTPAAWERELQVNLNGAFYLAQAGAARLRAHRLPGRIVFLGSWAAHAVHSGLPAYCVAKAGLRMLCRCMALEYAPDHILVNEVAPGWVNAGMSGRIFAAEPGRREAALRTVPTHALIEADEVAQQVIWLCDPLNRHCTGSVLLMDGGLSLLTPGSAPDA